jgi:predicted nucleic acid-binding protein
MKGVLVDSNVILDVFLNDLKWADWSESKLEEYSEHSSLYINSIIYSEISIGFKLIEDLESAIVKAGFQFLEIPKEALFLAGKTYIKYKKRKGVKNTPLPDFFIGAQAAVLDLDLLTRDVSRYQTYFPTVKLTAPQLFDKHRTNS